MTTQQLQENFAVRGSSVLSIIKEEKAKAAPTADAIREKSPPCLTVSSKTTPGQSNKRNCTCARKCSISTRSPCFFPGRLLHTGNSLSHLIFPEDMK